MVKTFNDISLICYVKIKKTSKDVMKLIITQTQKINRMRNQLIIVCLSIICFSAQSQNNRIDSLKGTLISAKHSTDKILAVNELARNYFAINQDSAIHFAELGVEWAYSSNNQKLEIESRLLLANMLSELDIPRSMKECFNALQMAERINDQNNMATCYKLIGLLNLFLGNRDSYIDYLKKAIAIYKKLNNPSGIISAYSEIGGAHCNPDSALYYLKLASEDSTQFNSAYHNYYWGINEPDPQKARSYFLKSIAISEEGNNLRGLSLASRWLSIFYQKNGELDSGIIAAKKGLHAAQQINLIRGIINNSEQLTKIYHTLNQTDSAYKYQTIMIAAKDSLFSHDKINKIQKSVIEEQQRVQYLQAEKNRVNFRIKLFAALGIILFLLLLSLFLYNNHRKSKHSNNLLLKHQKEIDNKNLELQQSIDTLKSTQTQLIHSEKLASLGALTAGIAHEIQNPLNFVNNFSDVNKELLEELKEEADKGNLEEVKSIANDVIGNEEKINHHGKRAESIVKGMLLHSRGSSGHKEPVDINALCDEYLRLSYHGFRAKDKAFNADFKLEADPSLLKIEVVPQDIGRVLLNLINNAFYAVSSASVKTTHALSQSPPDNPCVCVATKNLGSKIEISVKDNDPGIPADIADKIFQPFFTTKPTGQGTGLGLSLAYDIVKAHGGEIKVETKPARASKDGEGEARPGTEFIIYLPLN
jgi:two-component system, NtrC family, sensor kinase